MASQHPLPDVILIRAPNHRYCRSCTNEPPPLEQFYLRIQQIILLLHHLMNPCHFCRMIILIIEHLESSQQNQQSQPPPSSPKKSRDGKRPNTMEDGSKSLHKKTLSSISLRVLAGKDTEKISKAKESKPKKTKSSTNLATLLSRPKSSRNLRKQAEEEARQQKDKENRSPLSSSPADATRPPPIYAQFSSEYFTKQPLGGKFLEDEIDLYTPENYSPGKQRNFYEGPGHHPSLVRRDEGPQRPKSTYLPSSFSLQDISRRVSSGSRNSSELMRRVSGSKRPSFERKTTETSVKSEKSEKTGANRGQRVIAAVASFGTKAQKLPEANSGPILEDKNVDREFEAMLDRRNIPSTSVARCGVLLCP